MQERQDKLKGVGLVDGEKVGGILGRYVTHNTKQALQRPGMEQFAISIKLKSANKTDKDEANHIDGPHPLHLSSGSNLCFPKGILLPECLRQRPASECLMKTMEDKKLENVCSVCKSSTEAKKYKCSKTMKVTCSLQCYKKV